MPLSRCSLLLLLLTLLAARAGARVVRERRALDADGANPPPPKCEAALCLPRKRNVLSSAIRSIFGRAVHYCGAPEPLARTACVAPAAAPGARATTLASFCDGAANVQLTPLTLGDVISHIVFLAHEDPAYAKEQLWCKPTPAGEMPTAEYEKLALSGARPPWATDARRVSAKDPASPAVADHYARVWNRRLQPVAQWPLVGTATIAAPADGCGAVGAGAGVSLEGLAAKSSITCAAVPGGQVAVTVSMVKVQRGERVFPISAAALRLAELSAVAFVGPWPLLALRIGATFASGAAQESAAWAALADDVDAAIKTSNGVPRALRPFVYSFLASDPALFQSAAARTAAPGLANASPRAYFGSKTQADVQRWLHPCADEMPPYSSPAYDKLRADIAKLPAGKDAAKRIADAAALEAKFFDDFPAERAAKRRWAQDAVSNAALQPCKAFLQFWADLERTSSFRTNSTTPREFKPSTKSLFADGTRPLSDEDRAFRDKMFSAESGQFASAEEASAMLQFTLAALNIDRFVYDHFKAASADGTVVYPRLAVASDAANRGAVTAAIKEAQLVGMTTKSSDIKFGNDNICVLMFDVLENAAAAKATLQTALDKANFAGGLRPAVQPGYVSAYVQSHAATLSALLLTMPAPDVALLYIHLFRPAGPTRAVAALAGPISEARAAFVRTIPSSNAFKEAYKAAASKEIDVQSGLDAIDTLRAPIADVSFRRACDAEEPLRTFDLLLRAAHAGIAPAAAFQLAAYTAGLLALPGEASVPSLHSNALTHESLFVDQFFNAMQADEAYERQGCAVCGHVNVAKWAAQVNLAITTWQDAAATRSRSSSSASSQASSSSISASSQASSSASAASKQQHGGGQAAMQASSNANAASSSQQHDSRLIRN